MFLILQTLIYGIATDAEGTSLLEVTACMLSFRFGALHASCTANLTVSTERICARRSTSFHSRMGTRVLSR